jgi:hypothetical protein
VNVPDERLELLAAISQTEKVVPATVEFVDIAGLVKGAAEGQGLGNKFLSNIRECQALVHVVRCFDDTDVRLYLKCGCSMLMVKIFADHSRRWECRCSERCVCHQL